MRDWISFWNSPHSIYVGARHKDVHYRTIAEMFARHAPSPDAVVLAFGCGAALHADGVAKACRRLILVDAAPKIRAGLAPRFDGRSSIEVRAPAELADLPDRSIDLVVMHSVAQYLTSAEFSGL